MHAADFGYWHNRRKHEMKENQHELRIFQRFLVSMGMVQARGLTMNGNNENHQAEKSRQADTQYERSNQLKFSYSTHNFVCRVVRCFSVSSR